MGFRLKTSKETMEIFQDLENKTRLQPYILSKLAISLCLKSKIDVENIEDEDTKGLELNRQTIMGQYDDLYKCLIEQDLKKSLTDDEYFPYYAKKYLDEGAKLLSLEYEYSKNFKTLFESLLEGRKLI